MPREVVEEAVRAACTAPAPHHTRPWRFTALTSPAAKRSLLGAMAEAWRADLLGDGTPEETIARRLSKSDAVLGAAPVLIVPRWHVRGFVFATATFLERAAREQEMFLFLGGAAIQNLAFRAVSSVASCWISSTLFCQEETRAVIGMGEEWFALGIVAAGPMPRGAAPPRPPLDLSEFLRVL